FGSVYLAEQLEPVHRKVAVKVIKLGMDTAQVIARFEAERQALAMMDHPNVAKVLDAGATETGRPYFVMELVKGVPITEYCDTHGLSTTDRLELFIDVCHSVQHAHQKGVIHRDIKPSNVLVTLHDGRPVPKIIDFGIAKATNARLTEKTMFTEFRQLIGTPAYMSPEQAEMSGLDVDTRSDIYSLGVLLYELLTGTTPFDAERLRSASSEELQRIIREEEPDKPSTRLSSLVAVSGNGASKERVPSIEVIARHRRDDPAHLARSLRGDLDWIAIRCLEKDRSRRYETAVGLAADIQRHLENQPVEAGPPSAAYRVRKFVRRNRVMVAAATMVLAALLAGTAGTTFGLLRAEQRWAEAETARELAEKREAETQQVSDFQAAMFSEIDVDAMGRGIYDRFRERVRASLERQYVGEFPDRRKRTAEEIEAELAAFDQRASAAQAVDVARRVMDEFVLARATDAMEKQFADQPLVEAQLRNSIGVAYRELGIHDAAEPHLRSALEICRRVLGDHHPNTFISIHSMGHLLEAQGKLDEAESYFREMLEGSRRVLGEQHPTTLCAINDMGSVLLSQSKLADAEPYCREALEECRRVLGDDHPDTLGSICNMGRLLEAQGKLADAEPYYREALQRARRVLGDHPNTLVSISDMGRLLFELGQLADAERYCREALEKSRHVLGDDHPGTLSSINAMGYLLRARGKLVEAEPYLREALEANRRLLGDDDRRTLTSICNMGQLLHSMERFDDAEPLFREALEGRRRVLGEHGLTVTSIIDVGRLLRVQYRLSEAEPYFREALEMSRRVLGPDDRVTLGAIINMGHLLRAQGRLADAEPYYREVLEWNRRNLAADHPNMLTSTYSMGRLLQDQGKLADAEPYLLKALEGRRRVLGEEHQHTLSSLERTSWCLADQGKLDDVIILCRDYIEQLRSNVPDGDAALAKAMGPFALILIEEPEYEEAEPLLRECLRIRESTIHPDSPNYWLIAQTRSMLGYALAGRGAAAAASNPRQAIELYTEAEPLILDSYEWLSRNFEQIHPALPRELRIRRVTEAGERIPWLYETWHAAEPDAGHDVRAAEWRARLDDLPGP
ncbi:MAG: tetratricopeptide repeat protein, partial [Planctomycetota bacterium]